MHAGVGQAQAGGRRADTLSLSPPSALSVLPNLHALLSFQVPRPEEQHRVMQEAVENHMPQAIM